MAKQRKVPQRTCIGCRTVRPKRELIRVVRTPQGEIVLDPTGKQSGRGAYMCPDAACMEQALKKKQLERALEVAITPETIERLREELERVI
ncbi:MAG TPA: YlxR family protein [Firmicutes bacterium]|nr:YlxR family protein [Bacillota bacterium]